MCKKLSKDQKSLILDKVEEQINILEDHINKLLNKEYLCQKKVTVQEKR